MIICAGKSESFDFAKSIGIGLIDSSINLTRILMEKKTNKLIFIGSAGSYGKYKPFELVKSTLSSNIEIGFYDKFSYTPITNKEESSWNVSCETLATLPSTHVNSSNYITISQTTANTYQKNGLDVENMEFYSVLKVANYFNIQAIGVFVITNMCNNFAHEDFTKNHKQAIKILTNFLKELKE